MKGSLFTLAVLSVFAVLAYTIWLESSIIAEAYRIRELRESDADLKNKIKIFDAVIARATRPDALVMSAEDLGQVGFERHVARHIPERDKSQVVIRDSN